MIQRSLVIFKPDSVMRGVIGEILERFEKLGLKIVASKFIQAPEDTVKKHYKKDSKWHEKIGRYNIKDCSEHDLSIKDIFGTEDPVKIGEIVNKWLFEYFKLGPIFVFVFEGPNAVKKIRDIIGPTYPNEAPAGTIRGDYCVESALTSLKRKRAVLNLIHASGNVEEAEEEIKLWFKSSELVSYKKSVEDIYKY